MRQPPMRTGEEVRGTLATNRPLFRGYRINNLCDRRWEEIRPVAYHLAVRHDGSSARVAAKVTQWQERWKQRGYTPLIVYLAVLTTVVFYLAVTR